MGVKSFSRVNPSKKQIEVYQDFSGGLNTELADSATKDNQFRKIINFDMDAAGSLVKRPGLYRIPFIKTIIDNKFQHLIADKIITFEQYRDLEIKDVQQFFDGLHWIFNYITSVGLIVLILDANMNLPNDLTEEEMCLYYSLSNLKNDPTVEELENEVGDRIKINQYGSVYIMYATQYANATGLFDSNKKQVRLFSWNPIKDDTQTINNKPARPGWIEASDSKDVDDLIYYGKTEQKIINSNQLDLSDISNQSFEITPGKYIPPFLNDDAINQYSVEYKTNNVDLAWLEITKNGITQNYNIVDGDNVPISPNIIETCTLENQKIKIYFNRLVKMKLEWDKVEFQEGRYFSRKYSLVRNFVLYFNLQTNKFEHGMENFFVNGRILLNKLPGADEYVATNNRLIDRIVYYDGYTINVNPHSNRNGNTVFSFLLFDEDIPDDIYSTSLKHFSSYVYTNENNLIKFTTLGALFNFRINVSGSSCFRCDLSKAIDLYKQHSFNIFHWADRTLPGGGSSAIRVLDTDIQIYNFLFPYYSSLDWPGITGRWWGLYLSNYLDHNIDTLFKQDICKFMLNNLNTYVNYDDTGSWFEIQCSYWFNLFVHKQNAINLLRDFKNDLYRNILNKDNTQALASGTYFVGNYNVIPIRHTKKSFFFEKLTTSNLMKWLDIQSTQNEFLHIKPILGTFLFDRDKLNDLYEQYLKDNIIKLDFNVNYTYNGIQRFLQANLKAYEINDFLNALLHDDINTPKIFLHILKVNGRVEVLNFIWVDSLNKQHTLLELNTEILNGISVNDILSTLYFNFSYKQLIGGKADVVLTFKQQKYVKPNLNDLSYLWYNLCLFSRFTKKRWPDIYDTKTHSNISWDLVEYPNVSDTQQTNYMQLFGIVPVNNVILAPGKQRFQLFYNLREDIDKTNLRIALTAMTIKDYNQMINSPDYSTSGWKNDNAGNETNNETIGPNWKEFNAFFLANEAGLDDDKVLQDGVWVSQPKQAIFEVDVPTTTQPYMVLIQVAQTRFDDTDSKKRDRIKLSTVIETRIEMQPSSSYIEKINAKQIFDEFTTTTNLYTYSTNALMYGSTNKIFFSDNTVPSYFPLSRVIELKTPEAIKSCTVFQNKLIVATENSRWYIGGSSFESEQDPYYVKNISSDSGILAAKTDIPMGNYLYFLDSTGIKYLKNLYGTADKEFAYEILDGTISTQVPRDKDACACAYNNKYYICFPNYKYMLIYNPQYKAWVSYESKYLNFVKMFVNDGVLYGIDRDTFTIYTFDKDVFVDDWNEVEDGYEEITNSDDIKQKVQKGKAITCYLETKNLDQNYIPHRKKYDWVLVEANVFGIDGSDIKGVTKPLIPWVRVDDNLVNYQIGFHSVATNNQVFWTYQEQDNAYGIIMRDDSLMDTTAMLDFNRLGRNDDGTFYHIPIKRKGNTIAFGFEYNAPCGINIKSLSVKYGLLDIKKNRGGQS